MRIIISADKGNFADIRSAAGAEETIDWWDDANPASAVCTTCFAAVELYEHLLQLPAIARRTDNEVVLTESAEGDPGDWLLLVGGASANPATAAFEQRLGRVVSAGADAPEESYRVCTVMHEGMRYTVLSGRDRTGTLYAAYALLEKLGIRWYAPDECGTVFPPAEAPFFPEEGDETSAPAYTTRGIYTEFADDADERLIAWAARNRCNYALFHRIDRPHRLKKRGIRLGGGGHHLLHRFMNPKAPYPYRTDGAVGEGDSTTAEAHPEWFALIGGQRSFRTGNNPEVEGYYWGDNYCTSNSEATEELCSRVVDDLIGGAWSRLDYLDVWLYDNGVWCECEECAAQGNYTRRMALLVHELSGHIAKAIAAGRLKRNVKLIFAAYHECLDAPDRPLPDDFDYSRCLVTFFPIERCYVHDFADPCCTETNAKLVRQYESWTKGEERTYRGELFIGEYYNVSSFANMPLLFGDRIAADIPYYYVTGSRHFYYMHIPVKRWGMLAQINSLHLRLLWEPQLDAEAWTRRYLQDYYGPAADAMAGLYDKLESASAGMKYIKHYQEKGDARYALSFGYLEKGNGFFPLVHTPYGDEDGRTSDPNEGISFLETLRLFRECRAILDRTLAEAADGVFGGAGDALLRRLADDDMRLAYGCAMIEFYDALIRVTRLLERGEDHLAGQTFERARMYGDALERMTEPLLDCHYYPDLANGLKASWVEPAYRRLAERFGG